MSLLTDVRGDTSNIISDWGETITFQRATNAVIANSGGELSQTWYTSLVTSCDVQEIEVPSKGRAEIDIGGFGFAPEKAVYLRHGLDVREGDRFSADGFYFNVNMVVRDEDKIIAMAKRKEKE